MDEEEQTEAIEDGARMTDIMEDEQRRRRTDGWWLDVGGWIEVVEDRWG